MLLLICNHYLLFYKISYLSEKVNRNEPSLSVSIPWCEVQCLNPNIQIPTDLIPMTESPNLDQKSLFIIVKSCKIFKNLVGIKSLGIHSFVFSHCAILTRQGQNTLAYLPRV
jgi:hypothetical protein